MGLVRFRGPQIVKPPLRADAARFPLWAAITAEFGALSGQKVAQDPQWVWDAPWYRSFGVWRSSALRVLVFSHQPSLACAPVSKVACFDLGQAPLDA